MILNQLQANKAFEALQAKGVSFPFTVELTSGGETSNFTFNADGTYQEVKED